mgnify:CR=1 FL=1
MYYLYLKKILLIVISSLILFSLINFFVDPEKVYPKLFPITDPVLKEFAKEVTSSKYGILDRHSDGTWINNLNERERKKALALYSKGFDCAIIGSSRIKQISSFRDDRSLTKSCKSIINLGVSGGTLQDYFAYSNMLLENKNAYGTIVFGIDPWGFKFTSDGRWGMIQSDYEKMMFKLNITQQHSSPSYMLSLALNLINLEYLLKSLDKITHEDKTHEEKLKEKESFKYAEKFDQNKGISGTSITLPDGSRQYSSETINNEKENMKTFDGMHDYKINEVNGAEWFDEQAINDFTNLVKHLKLKFNVLFVMAPYHNKVWEQKQPSVEAMNSIENKIHVLAKQLNIAVIGSYNPDKIGCSKDEFFDAMHPHPKCLKKLE